ncbi:MAG: methyltransferase domain-containing protein [Thermotogota bacterium]
MSEVVRDYYNREVDSEWERLSRPHGRLEMESTLRLIGEHFPPAGRVADIGGGPGRYAIELLRHGYRVTLVDLAERNVKFAQAKLAELGLTADAVVCADARDLSFLAAESFDAALVLGPMYHLVEEADRRTALLELRRILKPGAPAIVGFINPWGVLRAGLGEFPELYVDDTLIRQLLSTCAQVGEQRAFTEASFLTPPQAIVELREAGFSVDVRVGAEGFAGGMSVEVRKLAEEHPEAYENVLRLVAETCDMPAFRDSTEHLQVVVRRLEPPA